MKMTTITSSFNSLSVRKLEHIYLSNTLTLYLFVTWPLMLIYVIFILIAANGAGIDSMMRYLLMNIVSDLDDSDDDNIIIAQRQSIHVDKVSEIKN